MELVDRERTVWNHNYLHIFILSLRYSDFCSIFAIFTFVQSGKRLPIPDGCLFSQIIDKAWSEDLEERPTFTTIVQNLEEILKI